MRARVVMNPGGEVKDGEVVRPGLYDVWSDSVGPCVDLGREIGAIDANANRIVVQPETAQVWAYRSVVLR